MDHVGNILFEQDRTKTGVESANTFSLHNLAKTAKKTASECGFRHKTNTGSLKRTKSDVGEEFSGSGRSQVDRSTIVRGSLVTKVIDRLLLEEFITSKLEGTLEEVAGGSRAKTSEQGASTFIGNDLAETTNETAVVCDRIQLNTGFDAEEG